MNELNVSLQHSIATLAAKGWSTRKIARELSIDRETAARYLHLAEAISKPAIVPAGSVEESDSKPAILPTGSPEAADSKPAIVHAGSKVGRISQCAPLASV